MLRSQVRLKAVLAAANICLIRHEEAIMARVHIDCREFPSEMKCTLAVVADSEEELLEAAVQHAVAVHQHEDSPEFRTELRKCFRQGNPQP